MSATLGTHLTGKGAFWLLEAVMTVVGRVVALWRYPVKSMAGERVDGADVSWHGLAGDRRWAFIRDGQVRSGFPWLTIRELPELAHYRPRFADPERPNASATLVRGPSGGEFDVADPALAAEFGPGVRVIKQNRGIFDTMPLSLLTTAALASLGRLIGLDLVRNSSGPTYSWRPSRAISPKTPGSAGTCGSAGSGSGWTSTTSAASCPRLTP
jgi:hypothetical protein